MPADIWDTLTEDIDGGAPTVRRNGRDQPYVTPPGGSKEIGYTRVTTFVDVLDDKSAIADWQQRVLLQGLLMNPSLLMRAQAATALEDEAEQRRELNAVASQAREIGGAHHKAEAGTAVHSLTETLDKARRNGEDPFAVLDGMLFISDDVRKDLLSYLIATRDLEPVVIEKLTVLDKFKVAGTPDRVIRYTGEAHTHAVPGRLYIADLKTGRIDYGIGKIAMQLGTYALADQYDQDSDTRTPWPEEVDLNWGIIIHLPVGSGAARLEWVNIGLGIEALDLAQQVRDWRAKVRAKASPLRDVFPSADDLRVQELVELIESTGKDDLRGLWKAEEAGLWSDVMVARVRQRLEELG